MRWEEPEDWRPDSVDWTALVSMVACVLCIVVFVVVIWQQNAGAFWDAIR